MVRPNHIIRVIFLTLGIIILYLFNESAIPLPVTHQLLFLGLLLGGFFIFWVKNIIVSYRIFILCGIYLQIISTLNPTGMIYITPNKFLCESYLEATHVIENIIMSKSEVSISFVYLIKPLFSYQGSKLERYSQLRKPVLQYNS